MGLASLGDSSVIDYYYATAGGLNEVAAIAFKLFIIPLL